MVTGDGASWHSLPALRQAVFRGVLAVPREDLCKTYGCAARQVPVLRSGNAARGAERAFEVVPGGTGQEGRLAECRDCRSAIPRKGAQRWAYHVRVLRTRIRCRPYSHAHADLREVEASAPVEPSVTLRAPLPGSWVPTLDAKKLKLYSRIHSSRNHELMIHELYVAYCTFACLLG